MPNYNLRRISSPAISDAGRQSSAFGQASEASTLITDTNSYNLITYNSSGTLTVTKQGIFEVLCIAGGGGGGDGNTSRSTNGGGGGAGGVMLSVVYLPVGAHTVTVGGGGAGSGMSGIGGHSYIKSSISSAYGVVAVGGGNGTMFGDVTSGYSWSCANTGGSGGGICSGGALFALGDPITGITGQGNSGGSVTQSYYDSTHGSGGGGGGGAVGANGTTSVGGAGGAGVTLTFTGTSTAFAGGGGGVRNGSNDGAGGTGGGGAGHPTAPVAGTANSGGGGGGGSRDSVNAAGGSGVVFVRFRTV